MKLEWHTFAPDAIMPRTFQILLAFLLLLPLFSVAADTLDQKPRLRTVTRYFFEKDFYRQQLRFHLPDTSPVGIERVNESFHYHYNFLGTPLSAADPQLPYFPLSPLTHILTRSYDLHLLRSDEIPCYTTNKRYTRLKYHTGAFKEQYIQVLHTQNISRQWNAGFIFDRHGVKEYMNFSNTFRSRFGLFTCYQTPDQRYAVFAHALWNTIRNGVNGGLTSDSLFENTNVTNLGIKGLAYQISEASQRIRKRTFYLSQYFSPQRGDSVPEARLRFNHRLSIERRSMAYVDPTADSSFYSHYYFDQSTKDSTHVDEFKNRITVQYGKSPSENIRWNWDVSLFAEHAHTSFGQRSDSSWNNVSVGALVGINDTSLAAIEGQVVYVADGMDQGSYSFSGRLTSATFALGRAGVSAGIAHHAADFYYRWTESNNFIWKNDFNKINTLTLGGFYEWENHGFAIHAERNWVDNIVFADYQAMPVQNKKTVSLSVFKLVKNFRFGRWRFDNTLTYQKSDNEYALPVPEWVTDQSFYYLDNLFRNALTLATGISMNYNSAYYAHAFMPSTAMFYAQREKKTGGYPRFDLFINGKIKTARIFLLFENFLDDVVDRSYFLTPHYPMPGRVLKFGIVWEFFDM